LSENDSLPDDLTRPDTLLADWDGLPESHTQWRPGQRLGPFRLRRQLGQGGMGLVWLAEQLEPFEREVAIKVMLAASTSPVAEAWFQIERQALAQLSHRAIAQIFDAGRLPDGGLFFAMEYVPGEPLDDYLERHTLSHKELAELLIEICSGVQHAHQRGLIHRDIKPANLLVSQVDGRAQPKLIDFGVAISGAGGLASPVTSTDRAGTRAYMAPEQLNPDASGIDARCDVYALGAVLAQCLFSRAGGYADGQTPFASSTARDNLARSMGTDIKGQSTESARLLAGLKTVPEALRAIALKAMATDRDQRYASAAALADDLRRWMRREPVTALADTRWYRARCFLNRHALASTAAALVGIALVTGVAMALYGLGEARLERAEAVAARDLAEQRRNDAEQLIQFMLGDFADQLRPLGRLDLLDGIGEEAVAYLAGQGAGADPVSALNRARALRTLGEVQVQRQQFERAVLTLAEAAAVIAPWKEDRSPALADLHFESGQIAFWRGAITYRQRDFDTAEVHWKRYLQDAQALAMVSDDQRLVQRELAYAYSNLCTLAEARNDWSEALEFFLLTTASRRELAELADDVGSVLDLAGALSWTSRVQSALGRQEEAWQSAQKALSLVVDQRAKAPDHSGRRQDEISYRYILANHALFLDRPDLAAEQLKAALPLAEEVVAIDPTRARSQAQLARIAFMLVPLPDMVEEAVELLNLGAQVLALEVELDPQQRVELPARHALARLQLNAASEESVMAAERSVNELVSAIAERDSFDAHFFALTEIVVQLMAGLKDTERVANHDHIGMVQARMDEIPPAQQQNLRYLLLRRDISQLLPGQSEQADQFGRQIETMRGLVDLNHH